MRKIIFASHHRMADGLKSTVEYIMGDDEQVTAISAYLNNAPVEQELKEAIGTLSEKDEVLIFTDMLGGSVNQACLPYLANPRVHLIAGMSLPVVMSILLPLRAAETITPEAIREGLQGARDQIVYVNDFTASMSADEDDE